MIVSFTLSSSHSTLVKLTCDYANASASLSIFVSRDVILSTLFHSSPSVPTSCFFIPHACVYFFSSMLLASVHHPDFMARDVSASRNLESELTLGISPPGLFGAFVNVFIQIYVHTYVHTYIQIYICISIYEYTYLYISIHEYVNI